MYALVFQIVSLVFGLIYLILGFATDQDWAKTTGNVWIATTFILGGLQ